MTSGKSSGSPTTPSSPATPNKKKPPGSPTASCSPPLLLHEAYISISAEAIAAKNQVSQHMARFRLNTSGVLLQGRRARKNPIPDRALECPEGVTTRGRREGRFSPWWGEVGGRVACLPGTSTSGAFGSAYSQRIHPAVTQREWPWQRHLVARLEGLVRGLLAVLCWPWTVEQLSRADRVA